MSHSPRLDYQALDPKSVKALGQFSQRRRQRPGPAVARDREPAHQPDQWLRILHRHALADLIKQGVEPRRINAVAGWREAHRFFSDQERAALAWAEAVNAVPHRSPSDDEFAEVKRYYSDAQIASLTFAVAAIPFLEHAQRELPHAGAGGAVLGGLGLRRPSAAG